MLLLIFPLLLLISLAAWSAPAPIVLDPTYDHDKWNTEPDGHVRQFRAFTSSFDTKADDDGDGTDDAMGVPEWVAYEMRAFEEDCIPTHSRPPWFSDDDLVASGEAPENKSYTYTQEYRSHHPDWFIRGHLAMKQHAARLGENAEGNTHTMLNAVPQRQTFNAGIWLDLEKVTAMWAQRFGRVWIVTGPIFRDGHAIAHMANEPDEFPVAIPEALYKIVIKGTQDIARPDVLAFIYPQVGPTYTLSDWDHTRFLTSVDEIEELTGLDFLTLLDDVVEEELESSIADALWERQPDDHIKSCQN